MVQPVALKIKTITNTKESIIKTLPIRKSSSKTSVAELKFKKKLNIFLKFIKISMLGVFNISNKL